MERRVYYKESVLLGNVFGKQRFKTMIFLSRLVQPNNKNILFLSVLVVVLIRLSFVFQADGSDFPFFNFEQSVSATFSAELQSAELPECQNSVDKSSPPCNSLYKRSNSREQTKNIPNNNAAVFCPPKYWNAQIDLLTNYHFVKLSYNYLQYTDNLFARDGPEINVNSFC